MKLIIAEKPMLAQAIADAIPGSARREQGYITKGEYTLTWAYGHLFALRQPEQYNPKLSKWCREDLPIYFPDWKVEPKAAGKEQLSVIQELLKKADMVIHAGDLDDEGQLLIDEILDYFQYAGMVYRIDTTDLSIEGMKKALKNLTENSRHKRIGRSAYARSVADFMVGINYSRFYSLLNRTTLSVGRVQTPTLGLVVARDYAIEHHQEQYYYELFADAVLQKQHLEMKYIPASDNPNLDDGYIKNRDCLDTLAEKLLTMKLTATVTVKKEKSAPPLPFNLVALQSHAAKKFGYGIEKTLAITQRLREKYKCITYNRSDCRYLRDEDYEAAPGILQAAMKNWGIAPPVDTTRKSKAFNTANTDAHTAIIPTAVAVDIQGMDEEERNIYRAICDYYIIQFLPPVEREKLVAAAPVPGDGGELRAVFSRILDAGYLDYLSDAADEDEESENTGVFPNLEPGVYPCSVTNTEVRQKKTKPPARYTDATLNKDMTCIAKYVQDEKIRALLREKDKDKKDENGSIGTSATRAAIIANLIKRGYLKQNSKHQLISTPLAREFYAALPDAIKKPDMTAKWWVVQEEIKAGESAPEKLFNMVLADITDIFQQDTPRLSASAVSSRFEKESIGACPRCGKPVYEGAKSYYCSGYKEGCKFSLWKENKYLAGMGKKEISKTVAKALLGKGRASIKGLVSKAGKKFDAVLVVEWAEPYPKFSLEFPQKKK